MRPVRFFGTYLRLQRWAWCFGRPLAWPALTVPKRTQPLLKTTPMLHLRHPFMTSSYMHSSHRRPFSCGARLFDKDSNLQKHEAESVMSMNSFVSGKDCIDVENNIDKVEDTELEENAISTCSGCGAKFQSSDPNSSGFVPKEKLDRLQSLHSTSQEASTESSSIDDVVTPVICKRCFSLKQYNTALNISLSAEDYLCHLSHLRDKKALILLMVDVSDFPGSVFPDLHTLLSPNSQVVIVANKVDLIPRDLTEEWWRHFKKMLVRECKRLSLRDHEVARVHFVSAKTGLGVSELADDIVESWGNRGDVYLLGCTNAGKSTLFNRLLVYMCGVKPGELNRESNVFAPMATISQWPGTTLGLLSFPIMSVGKRKRLMAQAQARKFQQALNPSGMCE